MGKRAEPGRHLTLADHVRDFDPFERCRSGDEGLEAQHWSNALLNRTVVLLDHVIEELDPNHLDRDRSTEGLQHSVDRFYPGSVGPAAVDNDLAGQAIDLARPGKELGRSRFVAPLREHEV